MLTSQAACLLSVLCVGALSCPCPVEARMLTQNPDTHARRRVLIVGLDGTRGDVVRSNLQQHTVPGLERLALAGAISTEALAHSSAGAWCTAPGWTSVLSGVGPSKHAVADNDQAALHHPHYPSLLRQAVAAHLVTVGVGVPNVVGPDPRESALDGECNYHEWAGSWGRVDTCNLTYRYRTDIIDNDDSELADDITRAVLLHHIEDPAADVLFGVFDGMDHAGHTYNYDGAANSPYGRALQQLDSHLVQLLDALQKRVDDHREEWLVIATSDHGGHEQSHDNDILDQGIFFAAAVFTPTSPIGVHLVAPVQQMDASPTVLHFLGLDSHPATDGRMQLHAATRRARHTSVD